MGAIECPCGQHLEAPDDDALVRLCREHVGREHPDMRIDTQVGEHFIESGSSAGTWSLPTAGMAEPDAAHGEGGR